MKLHNIFDVIVIGSGPSGIFTSIKLVEVGLNVALIDKSGNYYTRINIKDRGLTGFGGAAMRYDANLDYSNGVPEKSSLGEMVFGNKKIATKCIKEVYDMLQSFGLKKESRNKKIDSSNSCNGGLEIIDRGILPIGEKVSARLLKNIYDYLISKNIAFFEFTEVTDITKKEVFEVKASRIGKEKLMIKGKNIVFATGKLSVSRSRTIFDRLGVKYKYCDSIDIGVRIETKKKSTDQITVGCVNPKIIFKDERVISRTFCWCPGGRVINYKFEGISIIDGQHCHDNPTDQTNFGIATTVKFSKGVDGTKFGISYIKMFNEFTCHKVGVQIMKDFRDGNITSLKNIKKNEVIPTVLQYSLVDLNMLLALNIRERILKLVDEINKIYPEAVTDNSLIYGPVLERIFPKVDLDFNMESSIKGFYVVGDISGKAIGVVTGAAMGVKAASRIIQSIKIY